MYEPDPFNNDPFKHQKMLFLMGLIAMGATGGWAIMKILKIVLHI